MAWLSRLTLQEMGFAACGQNVLISDKASIYNCANIAIGNYVRIDDFCVLSAGVGGIHIGNNVHIAAYSSLVGAGKISLNNFSGLSARVSIYSSSDDYSGAVLTNPTVPAEFTHVMHADVNIGRHSIIGTGAIVLPGVTLEEGVAIGALSLVKTNCQAFGIYVGTPARRVSERKRDLLQLEQQYLQRLDVHPTGQR